VNAVIQMPTTMVRAKKEALAAEKRRSSTRRPKATVSSAVTATGIADGENEYTADNNAGKGSPVVWTRERAGVL
jgi:hypothetical protein